VREIRRGVGDGQNEDGQESGLREAANAWFVAGGGPKYFKDYQAAGQNRNQVGRPVKQRISVVRQLVSQEPDEFFGKNADEVTEKKRVPLPKAIERAAQEDESLQSNAAPPD